MPDEDKSLRSSLYSIHMALAAKMGCEAGWDVPLSYTDPLEEARKVRSRAGVCDVSHAGRIRVRGDGALELLERACTADVVHQEFDTSLPTLMCNERGGVVASGRLIRLENFWVLVTDPACRVKALEHLESLADQFDAKLDDQTLKTAMLAVDGPGAAGILDAVLPFRVGDIPTGAVKFGSILIARYIAERTDGLGDWGVRVSVPNMVASRAWRFITEKAGDNRICPVGIAARDALRIEAGLCRYGHELNETIDPLSAGLEEQVDFGHDFIGRGALEEIRAKGPARRRVGLVLEGGGHAAIARLGAAVLRTDGGEIGTVTSGTFSPTLGAPIAMAYVATTVDEGSAVRVGDAEAGVAALPFYSPARRE